MRLVAFRIKGYRRFEVESTLDLTPRVVAIVGPNEAGKTSLLNALEHLCDPSERREFRQGDFSGRDQPADPKEEILSALFALDASDREALRGIPEAEVIRLWRRTRSADGFAHDATIPPLRRDRSHRDQLASDFRRLVSKPPHAVRLVQDRLVEMPTPPDGQDETDEEVNHPADDLPEAPPRSIRDVLMTVADALEGTTDTLDESMRLDLRVVAEELASIQAPRLPRYLQTLGDRCEQLIAEQETQHPAERAVKVLSQRCPAVRVLRDADRQLESTYDFEDHDEPPAPLANLLALAGLDWKSLKVSASEPGNPDLATQINRGNRKLEETLHGSWKQATVSVRITEQGGVLNVYPYDAASDTHSRIEDRSDGFRSFLALLAFTTRHSAGSRKLILAIDEAELHLHYNAQADLVKVLTQQTVVPQIIYTTHSAGCLPEDLGSAIRVVRTIAHDRSTIENGFWSSEEGAGLTSLLMAMGAGAVAFTPARRAIITEGPSDALLLPALFRESLGISADHPLGIQVAGGLAWTPPRRLAILDTEAAHVVYLTDSDAAGYQYRQKLLDADVDAKRIFSMGSNPNSGLMIEDFVDKHTYLYVVNMLLKELRGYNGTPLGSSDIPNAGAATAVEKWTKQHKIDPISKTAIAEHLLRVSHASLAYIHWDTNSTKLPLLRKGRAAALRKTYEQIASGLQLEIVV